MPPEPLPWDRKDFFKERKHERSSSESLGGPSSVSRWRDNTPHHHGSSRWASPDFRRPSGHGKQGGGWRMFSEDSGGRGGGGGGSCSGSGDGKYTRSSSRENRVAFSSQKEWKGHSWETTASPNGNSHPHSDFVNSWDQLHLKEQNDKNGGVSNTGQRVERENSLGSIDWKPLKWTRSGSLSSRGSGFSHSSSSKSIGVDSLETKVEAQPNMATHVQSPSGDAATCVTSGAPAEDGSSRKKPRLGWGEGLAKYEKKKVEGPDEAAPKEAAATENAVKDSVGDGASNLENLHSNFANVIEKSPSLTGFSECASPATPSSVACSSSPGLEEKSYSKTSTVYNGTSYPSASPCPVSINQSEGLNFNLENLELTQFSNLSSSLSELLQSDDPSSSESGFVRSTALNKLLVWKTDISKTLEVTESEIDLLENELKSLVSDSGGVFPCPAASTSFPAVCKIKPLEEQCAASNVVSRPSPLIVLSGDMFMEKAQDVLEEEHIEVKDEDIDSPGTATSKFVEPLSLRKDVIPSEAVRQSDCSMNLDSRSENIEVKHSVCGVTEEMTGVVSAAGDGTQLAACASSGARSTDVGITYREGTLYDIIMTSNRDSANRASEVFNKLLPANQLCVDISRSASGLCLQNESQIKEKFAMKKRFLRFKERVITLKFRAFQHLWKEDLRLLSARRLRAKSQKKYELSSRSVHNGYQKHRSSIRCRFSSPAGNLSLVTTSEIIDYTNKLLSDSQVKIYRNTLKMPALILDKKERMVSRFISDNGLVEDPCAVEKERSVVNPWTSQEKEIFLNKLATFGKDFKKIASFLDHKTTADCVEFYYKNHKSDSFQKTKKKSEFTKQGKSYSTNTYLVTSGKRWNRETNAASLDMLGAVSEIAANVDDGSENLQKCTSRFYIGASSEYKIPRGDNGILERSSSLDVFGNERETAAADVLAGICGSISSEAMSSCITSSLDPGDGYHQDWKSQRAGGSSKRRHLTPEITQSVIDDETCSDESCGEEIDAADWTDEEKSIFIQAVASYGRDFAMISQCMGTRSRDQCKVFFSKARKCLGLDMIHPEPCSEGTMDANGGDGSDAGDACMVETGSVICRNNVSLGCKKEEGELQLSDLKVEQTDPDPAVDMNLHRDLNRLEDKKDVELRSEDLVPDDSEVADKPEINLVGVNNTEDGIEAVSEVNEATEDVKLNKARESEDSGPAISEEVASVEERNGNGLPSTSGAEVENKAIGKVSVECSRDAMLTNKLPLPAGTGLDATISGVDGQISCPTGDSDSANLSAGDRNSSLGLDFEHRNALELDTAQKPCVISLGRDNHSETSNSQKPCVISLDRDNRSETSNSLSQETIGVHHRKALSYDDTSSRLDFRKSSDRHCQKSASTDGYHQHLPMHSLLDCVESSQILRGYPITLSTKNGMNGDVSCSEPASSLQSTSNLDSNNLHMGRYWSRDSFLQKCNGPKRNGLMSELPFLSREQKQSSSSEGEKPCRSGDVKLFGQILSHPSSQQQKPSCSSAHENEDKGAHHSKLNGGKSFNLKFGGNQSIDRNSFTPKFEQNNHLSVENNLPLRSYGFWDGNRIQTGLPSLPDSAILLAKYPAAFGNCPTSTSKIEPQPLHSVVKSNERGLNGVSVFPTREINSSSRVPEYQMYRSRDATKFVQPFTVDQLRQDFLFSEMQRRKEIELLSSSIHQQGRRGMVGINMGGGREAGVLVGGLCNGVSDPVAAIKMHYAKTEQFGGSIIREDESWRGNGDIGRR